MEKTSKSASVDAMVKEKPIGSIFSVKLSPLKKYPSLLNWTIKNDLTISKKETIYIPTQS